jgi:hypothetical protein
MTDAAGPIQSLDLGGLVARYRRTTGNFARFLVRVGLCEPEE